MEAIRLLPSSVVYMTIEEPLFATILFSIILPYTCSTFFSPFLLLSLQCKLGGLYHREDVMLEGLEGGTHRSLLQRTVGLDVVAEAFLHLVVVYVDSPVVAGDELVVGRIEHHGTAEGCQVLSEAVVYISPELQDGEERGHHVNLVCQSVVAHRGYAGAEDDERYMVV